MKKIILALLLSFFVVASVPMLNACNKKETKRSDLAMLISALGEKTDDLQNIIQQSHFDEDVSINLSLLKSNDTKLKKPISDNSNAIVFNKLSAIQYNFYSVFYLRYLYALDYLSENSKYFDYGNCYYANISIPATIYEDKVLSSPFYLEAKKEADNLTSLTINYDHSKYDQSKSYMYIMIWHTNNDIQKLQICLEESPNLNGFWSINVDFVSELMHYYNFYCKKNELAYTDRNNILKNLTNPSTMWENMIKTKLSGCVYIGNIYKSNQGGYKFKGYDFSSLNGLNENQLNSIKEIFIATQSKLDANLFPFKIENNKQVTKFINQHYSYSDKTIKFVKEEFKKQMQGAINYAWNKTTGTSDYIPDNSGTLPGDVTIKPNTTMDNSKLATKFKELLPQHINNIENITTEDALELNLILNKFCDKVINNNFDESEDMYGLNNCAFTTEYRIFNLQVITAENNSEEKEVFFKLIKIEQNIYSYRLTLDDTTLIFDYYSNNNSIQNFKAINILTNYKSKLQQIKNDIEQGKLQDIPEDTRTAFLENYEEIKEAVNNNLNQRNFEFGQEFMMSTEVSNTTLTFGTKNNTENELVAYFSFGEISFSIGLN